MVAFVVVLVCSNFFGPGKVCLVELPFALPLFGAAITFGAGNIFFPISYIFGDVLTEVYGYARARKVIWAGFGAMIFATIMSQVLIVLPPDPNTPFNKVMQPALETMFGNAWRIVAASILAFWLGDFANSFVMAKMKVLTRGRYLWTRTISSTMVGQGVDSLVFYPIAFGNIWGLKTMVSVIAFNWFFKVMVEVVMTPATYAMCGWLKRKEGVDVFDTNTNFSPFSLKT